MQIKANTILVDKLKANGVETMTLSMILIVSIGLVQMITIIFFITYYRKWVPRMNGMMVSMALGMTAGILFGTILGAILHGDLVTSTIYSILIGVVIGFIAGLPLGLLAILDGVLAGLMGGMMGAMLGDMVAMASPDVMIKLLSFFVTMILLLVLYATESSIRKLSNDSMISFFNYPYLTIFLIALVFIGLKQLGPVV
ncbi:hypothetical protein QGM71_13815 [Virgibacillus sp. C22-A2]|uniref:Uncharacterized protein n=1 Tax=Virgibacillus tibetensis TaxID=3042313 RepID=A0ABU6KGY5_9BACI|nr:hypothetical protein [Virgibacillus sp. C22-A2]